jgi:hypothetical protein
VLLRLAQIPRALCEPCKAVGSKSMGFHVGIYQPSHRAYLLLQGAAAIM